MVRTIVNIIALAAATALLACHGGAAGQRGPRVLQEYELTGPQRERLHELRRDYYARRFHQCMKEQRRVSSCGDCTAVSFRVIITIGGDGRLLRYAKVHERFCGEPALPAAFEACLAAYLRALRFPEELRGLTVECDLGRALKC